jgi:hypothetical protein
MAKVGRVAHPFWPHTAHREGRFGLWTGFSPSSLYLYHVPPLQGGRVRDRDAMKPNFIHLYHVPPLGEGGVRDRDVYHIYIYTNIYMYIYYMYTFAIQKALRSLSI